LFRRSRSGRTKKKSATSAGTTVLSTLLRRPPVLPVSYPTKGQLYHEWPVVLAPTIGVAASYVFSANGMYDPNVTSTGHQPIAFDQLMLWYNQVTVLRSHIHVTFNSNSAEPTRIALFLSPDGSAITDPIKIMENGLLRSTYVSSASTTAATGDGKHRFAELSLDCDIPIYFGKSREGILADHLMSTTVAGNPSEQVYFVIAAWGTSGAATSVVFDVTISYDALYWEPKKLATS